MLLIIIFAIVNHKQFTSKNYISDNELSKKIAIAVSFDRDSKAIVNEDLDIDSILKLKEFLMNKNKTKRLQFEFSEKSIEKLDELVKRCESTRASVIRSSIKLYNYIIDQVDDGYQIQLIKDGQVTTIVPVLP